jgi:hypothetical protein
MYLCNPFRMFPSPCNPFSFQYENGEIDAIMRRITGNEEYLCTLVHNPLFVNTL